MLPVTPELPRLAQASSEPPSRSQPAAAAITEALAQQHQGSDVGAVTKCGTGAASEMAGGVVATRAHTTRSSRGSWPCPGLVGRACQLLKVSRSAYYAAGAANSVPERARTPS